MRTIDFKRRVMQILPAAVILAGFVSARACDCAICQELPPDEAARIEDFHKHLDEVVRESTKLRFVVAEAAGEHVDAQLLAFVKKWLSLHNSYFDRGPGKAVPEAWERQMVLINRLVADCFRDGRKGDFGEVRRKAEQFLQLITELDRSVGAPSWHVPMLDLRNTLALSLEPDSAATAPKDDAWLETRLEKAFGFWKDLPESRRPDGRDGKPLNLADDIDALLKTPPEQRADATRVVLAFLEDRLVAFRDSTGKGEGVTTANTK